MMSTDRRASGIGTSLTASSPRAPNNAAVPRDLQRPGKAESSTTAQPGSPDRKRPRYEPGLGRSTVDERRSHGADDEEELDELDETEDMSKRPRGESAEPNNDRKGSGPDSTSRSSSAAAHHAHWAGRSASANLDSRYHQHNQPTQQQHRPHEEIDSGAAPDSRRYEYERAPPSRYEAGPGIRGVGRQVGGLVGERFGGEPDRDPRDPRDPRDRLMEDHRMEYNPTSMRMLPPNPADSNVSSFRNRPSSPPPRLPGFASLESERLSHRTRDETALGGPYSSSPRRGMPFHSASYSSYPPPSSRTPLLHHRPSPTPSTPYGNPPMIHPSLAGLPGAGGGPGGKQQPSFVSKLYSMLEDPSIADLISWGSSGTVFSVANPAEFSRLVLPNWFKHSNWQSFVRQLNMYGFHKVNHSYQGNPTDEVQVWEFRHPSFRRGEIALLNDIKRKSSRQKRGGSPRGSLGGDMRADRSGGSSTPSPEVPLATIPGGPDAMRMMGGGAGAGMSMGPGGYRGGREFAYGDERMDAHGYTDRREMRGFGPERGYGGGAGGGPGDEYGYVRPKVEGPPGMTNPSGPPAAAGMAPPFASDSARRAGEPYLDRAEAIARFEDLSERTDAIIRHASFLESQIRILSDQLADSRAMTSQIVREEMVQMLDRLERALSSPPPPGMDPTARMLDVIRGQLSYYTHRSSGSADRSGKQPPPPGAPKRPSI